jgi:hypothetical protein
LVMVMSPSAKWARSSACSIRTARARWRMSKPSWNC